MTLSRAGGRRWLGAYSAALEEALARWREEYEQSTAQLAQHPLQEDLHILRRSRVIGMTTTGERATAPGLGLAVVPVPVVGPVLVPARFLVPVLLPVPVLVPMLEPVPVPVLVVLLVPSPVLVLVVLEPVPARGRWARSLGQRNWGTPHGVLGGPCRGAGSFTRLVPDSRSCQVKQAAAERPAPDGDRGRSRGDPGGARPDLPHHLLQAPHPHRGPPAGTALPAPRPGVRRHTSASRTPFAAETQTGRLHLGEEILPRHLPLRADDQQQDPPRAAAVPGEPDPPAVWALPPTPRRGACRRGSSLRRVPGSTACAPRSPSCSSPSSTRS